MQLCLSFDIEEHDRIEAAVNVPVPSEARAQYGARMADATRWLLDQLDQHDVFATFFVVGQIAETDPALVRAIHDRGHEVASHGWDHRRILAMSPDEFRSDLLQSKDALEQVTGQAVVGYRAPTFSILRKTAWAIDILRECGFEYDSSIYPVRHDRYGIADAPRGPFIAIGQREAILEIPPLTYRVAGVRVPMGGGGYFRLFPLTILKRALRQTARDCDPAVGMLYFHPWEFDADQPRLPLRGLNRFRTYVGLKRTPSRLAELLARNKFVRAIDLARKLRSRIAQLPEFQVAASSVQSCPQTSARLLAAGSKLID
jgi:polysaccharide deacetylase family protein (PEP-CTERM system associated)